MPTGEFPRMAVRGTALPEVIRKMGGGGGGLANSTNNLGKRRRIRQQIIKISLKHGRAPSFHDIFFCRDHTTYE